MSRLELRAASWNLANVSKRWPERRELLRKVFRELAPEVCGLQEAAVAGERQDELLAVELGEHARVLAVESPRFQGFGIAMVIGRGEVLVHEQVDLGEGRAAQRVLLALPGGLVMWFANTHLHHAQGAEGVREGQARALAAWMEYAPRADFELVTGDFNDVPGSAAYRAMELAGYRSAYREARGGEPASTRLPLSGPDEGKCVDYLWLRGEVTAREAWLAGLEPAAGDPGLYASDHAAVAAVLTVG